MIDLCCSLQDPKTLEHFVISGASESREWPFLPRSAFLPRVAAHSCTTNFGFAEARPVAS